MSAWNRESPEALVKVQQLRIAGLEAENERLKGAIKEHRESFDEEDLVAEEDRILWAALEGGDE